jgi:mono/diheme cytochrome c family protein
MSADPTSAPYLKRVALLAILVCLAIASAPVMANPFPKGSATVGKQLHDPRCAACHNSMFPDKDGTQLYSDLFRKMDTPSKLKGMIEFCNNRTNSGWFEEDIQNVARYLNDTYYQFK